MRAVSAGELEEGAQAPEDAAPRALARLRRRGGGGALVGELPLGEQLAEAAQEVRVLAEEDGERRLGDLDRLDLLRRDGGRAARLAREQRHLSQAVSRAEHRDHR